MTTASTNISIFETMKSKKKGLLGLNEYSQCISEKLTQYVRAGGKLTTIVCITCEQNFKPRFDDMEARSYI